MDHLIIPKDYKPDLNLHDTQVAIKTVKDCFQELLAERLNLTRVSAPLFVDPDSGLNDNLNGVERPVAFDIKEQDGKIAEIVHSLAKWKRYALDKYGFQPGEGLYTDMSAIRQDEETDNIHSIYVDQWDWEKIITKEERNLETLKETVRTVYKVLAQDGKVYVHQVRLHSGNPSTGHLLCHHAGTGRCSPDYFSKGTGILYCQGQRRCLHHADR